MSALRLLRTATIASFVLVLGSIVSTSCATPEFDFGEGPALDAPGGANGSGGTGSGATTSGGSGGVPSAPHCQNRKKDADETDTDCGGIDCAPCKRGSKCKVDSDCVNEACTGERCQDPSCTDDFKNGDETDLNCGGEHCGPCDTDARCIRASDCASQVCQSGKCKAPTCSDRKQNQNEVDVDCGGDCPPCDVGQGCVIAEDCRTPSPTSESQVPATCNENMTCELVCSSPHGDCNRKAADGCETNTSTDVNHCGGCGERCSPAHATPQCIGGACGIQVCDPGYADVNGLVEDGCEVHHLTDPEHCGTDPNDLKACSSENGTPDCNAGECTITCNAGFDDCNEDVSDGCEADLSRDVNNCTACNNRCLGGGNLSPYCDATDPDGNGNPCGTTTCPTNQGDCDGDGLCTDDLTTVTHCGSCGAKCTTSNGTPACSEVGGSYSCTIASCNANATSDWEDCDGVPSSCEVNVLDSNLRCGGCLSTDPNPGSGKNCAAILNDATKHVASVDCDSGTCKVLSCTDGWADCDGAFDNGCEVNTATNATHCGGCSNANTLWSGGTNCRDLWANADGTCTNSACVFSSCDAGRGDCNNDRALGGAGNGCETTTTNNAAHCGGCGLACTTNANTSANVCSGTTCVPSCNAGFCPATDPKQGCTNPLGTAANCTSCGNVCQGGTPFCHAGVGCRSYRAIGMAQRQSVQFNQQSVLTGTTANNFNVTGTETGNRLLVVGISRRYNNSSALTVRYGNADLTALGTRQNPANSSYSAIYALSECALAAQGNQRLTVSVAAAGDNFGAVLADAMLFRNVAQPTASLVNNATDGPSASLPSVTMSSDSWFYGIATSIYPVAWTGTSPAGAVSVSLNTLTDHHAMGSLWGPLTSDSRVFTWTPAAWTSWTAIGFPLVPATSLVSCP